MDRLSNTCASDSCQRLYHQLCRWFGRYVIIGQQESPVKGLHEQEIDWLSHVTGQRPAIRGLDFIHNDFAGVTERALRWRDQGGIVTICWHTGVDGIGYRDSQAEHPDVDEIITPNTELHDKWMKRLDAAASALQQLKQEDVPVLWRPYHEFEGRWFWWGKDGPAAFKELWRMTWLYLTKEHSLNNLIWVLGFADDARAEWYPGDEFVDIAGSDTYKGVTAHATSWRKLRARYPQKIAAFHETGLMPHPDAFFNEGSVWSWIMPWHGHNLMQNNSCEQINELYHDQRFITLETLTMKEDILS